jgi:ATP-dependent RNA helicase RhlE
MNFDQLGLSAELLRAIDEQGYREATPIQQQTIPLVLDGRDVLAGAQTGTGKTAGFALPILSQLQNSPRPEGRRPVRVLVLAPTRELAAQVCESFNAYGRHLPFTAMTIFGGVSIRPQISQLRKGVDIVVATPGRLLDHLNQNTINLMQVEMLVLDEADRMLDMGFIRDMRKIFNHLPKRRQTMLFSATFSREIRDLAANLLHDAQEVQVATRNTTADRVEQVVYPVDKRRKRELLSESIGRGNWRQVLVFSRTKHGANRLAKQLTEDGINAAAIHGNKSQGARTKALADFKAGRVRVLVATDIAARGLDIERLPYVVNYELPNVPEDYVHRIGRTARAGQDGHAVSLVCIDEHKLLRDIEKLLNTKIPQKIIEGYQPDPSIKATPPATRAPRGGNRRDGAPGRGRGGSQGGRSGNGGGRARSGR